MILKKIPADNKIAWQNYAACKDVLKKQGSHRLEKYLNLEGLLEKSLKIDKNLEKYKIVVPVFGAAYAAPNTGTTSLC